MKNYRFDAVLTGKDNLELEAAACIKIAQQLFNVKMADKEVPVFGMDNMRLSDKETCASHGYVCRLVSRGCKNGEGTTAYTEPCFLRPDDELAAAERCLWLTDETGERQNMTPCIDAPVDQNTDAQCVENDNSIDIHPYYIRTSFSGGLWLDVVTVERWGEGILTKPVSVKAMHNWAEHAINHDKDLFYAAVM